MTATTADAGLVRRAQAGDRAALVALYRRYVGEIHGYLYNQTGSVADAEDLTSETFLRVVKAINTFEGRSTFRTWLYQVARYQLRDKWRRNGRRPPTVSIDDFPAEPPLPGAADPALTRLGRHVMATLPDNYRDVLRLRIIEERSVRETASILGKSETNVKVLTHRALKRAAAIGESMGEVT